MKISSEIKKDFPLLKDSDFVYLDSGATSQKPQQVIDAITNFYCTQNANPHRGAYELSILSSQVLDNARASVQKLLNAKFKEEIIFTKNATESLNLIAYSYGMKNISCGDEIVLSIFEHHSMIVPWQNVAKQKNAILKFMYLNKDYQIDDAEIERKITSKTKVVGISTVSNVLGTVSNYEKIIKRAHHVGAVVIVDISQSIAHMPFDVMQTDADFVVFSAHKMYGPMGVGVLYAKKSILEKMPPFLFGGDMIEYVYEDYTTFAELPNKFEAGTQNIADIAGLKGAIDYINNIKYENIQKLEKELLIYAIKQLTKLNFLELYIPKSINYHQGVVSFNVKGVHPHDVASILDMHKVCIRAGNHCAQPLLRYMGLDGTCRISISIYNTKDDMDKLIDALKVVYETFKNYIK